MTRIRPREELTLGLETIAVWSKYIRKTVSTIDSGQGDEDSVSTPVSSESEREFWDWTADDAADGIAWEESMQVEWDSLFGSPPSSLNVHMKVMSFVRCGKITQSTLNLWCAYATRCSESVRTDLFLDDLTIRSIGPCQ